VHNSRSVPAGVKRIIGLPSTSCYFRSGIVLWSNVLYSSGKQQGVIGQPARFGWLSVGLLLFYPLYAVPECTGGGAELELLTRLPAEKGVANG